MHIRTVTLGVREDSLPQAIPAALKARAKLEDAGYEVKSLRLALSFNSHDDHADLSTIAADVEAQALAAGFNLVSLGRVSREHMPQVPDALARTKIVCCSGRIAGRDGNADPEGILAAAKTIIENSRVGNQGMANFRFAAVAGVSPGTPFFPASYHDGGTTWIAIGPDTAALGHEALQQQPVQHDAFLEMPTRLKEFTKLIEQHDRQILTALRGLDAEHKIFVTGCDWSLTCGSTQDNGVGSLIEALSGLPFGAMGTLVAIHELSKAIRAARVNLIGFSGIILAPLTDATLAHRNMQEPPSYTLRDLLAFSSAHAIGFDSVLLPGDCSVEQIAHLLGEVAALSEELRRPLIARLLLMPGLKARDIVDVQSIASMPYPAYMLPTRVMELA